MKLMLCRECGDVVNLTRRVRRCSCRLSSGKYERDGIKAWYSGPCVPLGFANWSITNAAKQYPYKGEMGIPFVAFVIPEDSPNITHREKK